MLDFCVESIERVPRESIDPRRAFAADVHEILVAEDSKVIRHRARTDRELVADHGAELTRRVLTTRQNLNDSTPNRLGEKFEEMHHVTVDIACTCACASPGAGENPRSQETGRSSA